MSSPALSLHHPLRIGFVGCGQITEVHRDGYRLFDLPVVAGTDVSPAAREKFSAQEPQARVHEHIADLLRDPEVDVLDVSAPHRADIRRPLLEEIVRSGKPVLLQKPFAHSYADALEYAELFEKAGVPLMINQNSLFAGGVLELSKAILFQNSLGRLLSGTVTHLSDFNPGDHPWYGKGSRWWLSDMAVHELAIVHHLLGVPEVVFAVSGRDAAQTGVQGDGFFHLILRYASGPTVLVQENGAYYGKGEHRIALEFHGEKGWAGIVPGKYSTISRRSPDAGPSHEQILTPYRWFPEAFGLAMHHFQFALKTGQKPLCSAASNLQLIAIIEAAYRSAETGAAVRIDSIVGNRAGQLQGPGGLSGPTDWIPPVPKGDALLLRDYSWATYTPEKQ